GLIWGVVGAFVGIILGFILALIANATSREDPMRALDSHDLSDALVEEGIECVEANDFAKAEKLFSEAITVCATHVDAWFCRASFHHRVGNGTAALQDASREVKL